PGDHALVHPDVEAVRVGHRPHDRHGVLGELGEFGRLGGGELGVVGHVAIRHDHEVARVVRIQVQDRVDAAPACDDQRLVVGHSDEPAERAPVLAIMLGLVLAFDVRHPVRGPESLKLVRNPDTVLADEGRVAVPRRGVTVHGTHCPTWTSTASAVGEVFSLRATQSAMTWTARSVGTPLICVPSPNRNDTAPASTSLPPASNRNGTFWVVWVRIFFCIRSSLVSTLTRIPLARNAFSTS